MNIDELIQEAYRRYPIGTWFKSIHSDKGEWREVRYWKKKTSMEYGPTYGAGGVRCSSGMGYDDHSEFLTSNPVMYRNGVWCPTNGARNVELILAKYESNG